jgi:hypothetical protein
VEGGVTVRPNRNGARDLSYSDRHRSYGDDVPCTDIDFLEYRQEEACALIEMKHEGETQLRDTNRRPLVDLANRASIPAILCVYSADFSRFTATALNGRARSLLGTDGPSQMNERQWVTLLYRLRHRRPPERLFDGDVVKCK